MTSIFVKKPSEIRNSVIRCMEKQIVPFIQSSPGLGKSAIVQQIAKDFSLELIDLRLSQCVPEDLMGLPMRVEREDGIRATFAPFEMFPGPNTPIPNGKNGWLLFIDEMNSATKMVQAAAYKLALDRMAGQQPLHDNVYVVAAGNLSTDKAIVNELSTAMQSRVVHLEMVVDHKDFMDHAHKEGFDERVLAFLEYQPSKLHDFKPDHADKTFACPRTWEFASRLIEGLDAKDVDVGLIAGAVSEGVAVEFSTFLQVYNKLPSYHSISTDPKNTSVPTDAATSYAVIMMLVSRFEERTFESVAEYVERMSPEFRVIFFRSLVRRHKEIRRNKVFSKNLRNLSRYLNDDDESLFDVAA